MTFFQPLAEATPEVARQFMHFVCDDPDRDIILMRHKVAVRDIIPIEIGENYITVDPVRGEIIDYGIHGAIIEPAAETGELASGTEEAAPETGEGAISAASAEQSSASNLPSPELIYFSYSDRETLEFNQRDIQERENLLHKASVIRISSNHRYPITTIDPFIRDLLKRDFCRTFEIADINVETAFSRDKYDNAYLYIAFCKNAVNYRVADFYRQKTQLNFGTKFTMYID